MNRGADSQKSRLGGYTIVEVMIFLAASTLLFISTMALLAGRQQKVEFTNAVRDFETKLTDVANDVANGYYQAGPTNFECSYGTSGPVFTGSSAGQGQHKGCIFLGRLVKLGQGGGEGDKGYGIYSVVGNRTVGVAASSANVESLTEAKPKLFWTGDENLRDQKIFGFGTKISCIGKNTDHCTPGANSNAGIAFITKVTGVPGDDVTGSGIRAELHVFDSINIADDPSAFQGDIDANHKTDSAVICLRSGSTDQYALIFLGSAGGSGLTVKSEIRGGDTCGA